MPNPVRITLEQGNASLSFDLDDDTDIFGACLERAEEKQFSLLFGVDICVESLETGCIVRSGRVDWEYVTDDSPTVIGIEWD